MCTEPNNRTDDDDLTPSSVKTDFSSRTQLVKKSKETQKDPNRYGFNNVCTSSSSPDVDQMVFCATAHPKRTAIIIVSNIETTALSILSKVL